MSQMSVSFHTKKGMTSITHNNRTKENHADYNNDKIDRDKIQDNVYLKQQPIEEAYENLFGDEVRAYNKTQKRKSRRIKNYYEDMKDSKKYDEQREIIVQVGRFEDFKNSRDPHDMRQQAKKILEKVYEDFLEKNKNLHVYNAVIHMDESTPHMHLNIIPVADGYSRGVKKKPGFYRALKQQGIDGENNQELFDNWVHSNRDVVEDRMKELTNWNVRTIDMFEREKNKVENHQDYKKLMRVRDELEQKEIELKKIRRATEKDKKEMDETKDRLNFYREKENKTKQEIGKLSRLAREREQAMKNNTELKKEIRQEVEEEYTEYMNELQELREQQEHDAELLEEYEETCKEYELLADELTKEYVRLPEKIVKLVNGIASWGSKFGQDIWNSAFQRHTNQRTQQQRNRDDFER